MLGLHGGDEQREALDESVVDDALVLVCLDLEFSLLSLHVHLALFGPDEGSFVDIGMDLDIRIVAEFQRILLWTARC